jgi:type II restriction enzyme
MNEMQAENVILVVPRPYISTYPTQCQERIWTVAQFVDYVKEMEGQGVIH